MTLSNFNQGTGSKLNLRIWCMYLDKKTCSKLREKIEKMVELFLGKLGSD